jgi:aconitate hydratase
MAFSGNLSFDPTSDPIPTPSGSSFRFSAPIGSVLPPNEYVRDLELYCPPLRPEEREHLVVDVDPTSDRIQLVQPFKAWEGGDEKDLEMLIKVKGKCSESIKFGPEHQALLRSDVLWLCGCFSDGSYLSSRTMV